MKLIVLFGAASLASAHAHANAHARFVSPFDIFNDALSHFTPGSGSGSGSNTGSGNTNTGSDANSKDPHAWIAAGSSDARSPCPMLNTLANQGFIHRDGRNITREALAQGFIDSLNFDPTLASAMFDNAIMANPKENATDFDLDQLNTHNLLEHDASISRLDAYFGNNHVFSSSVFAETKKYFPNAIVTLQNLANAKLARQVHSKAFNPTYTYTETTESTSYNEMGFPVIAFGDMEKGTVNRDYVEYFFENERLPTEVGWVVRSEPVTAEQMGGVAKRVGEMVGLVTGSSSTSSSSSKNKKRAAHDFEF
ncbi:Peroxidase, family 2-domain-containing protein [Aspergillus venezuelensis]